MKQTSTGEKVDGVQVAGSKLEAETERLMSIVRRLNLRVHRWLKANVDTIEVANGQFGPVVTPLDVVKTVEVTGKIVTSLLKEQRERLKIVNGRALPDATDEELEDELQDLLQERLTRMPKSELDRLMLERGAIDAASREGDEPPPVKIITVPKGEL